MAKVSELLEFLKTLPADADIFECDGYLEVTRGEQRIGELNLYDALSWEPYIGPIHGPKTLEETQRAEYWHASATFFVRQMVDHVYSNLRFIETVSEDGERETHKIGETINIRKSPRFNVRKSPDSQ